MYFSSGVVFGFHGCDKAVFDKVIKHGEHLNASQKKHDWLGHGIYFWEGNYQRALDWAENHDDVDDPAVVGAIIKLGNCVDLLDTMYLRQVKSAFEILSLEFEELGKELPENKAVRNGISFNRELDCEVIMRLHQMNNDEIRKKLGLPNMDGNNMHEIQKDPDFFDSVRAMFPEGKELYDDAGFLKDNHIQLCIVNPNAIIGYFDPRKRDETYKTI